MKKQAFSWRNLSKVPDDEYGVYSIWTKYICIYVGKAEKQSLRQRLLQHYKTSHNNDLYNWIISSHQLWFSYETVSNKKSINAKERNRIKRFAPITNKVLQKKEFQYGVNSPCL